MVFIVKIPGRSTRTSAEEEQSQQLETTGTAASTSSSSSRDTGDGAVRLEQQAADSIETASAVAAGGPSQSLPTPAIPAVQDDSCPEQLATTTSIQDALDGLSMLSIATPSPEPVAGTGQEGQASLPAVYPPLPIEEVERSAREEITAVTAAPPQPSPPPQPSQPLLDIIVAPAVLAHRYIRGRDVSLIVERPERIRAVLLGVSALLARMAEVNESGAAGSTSSSRQGVGAGAGDADDLIAQLQSMSVQGQAEEATRATPLVQVLHSTKSLSLNPAHPALAAVHAHQEEMVEQILPECEEKRRRRGKLAGQAGATENQQGDNVSAPAILYSSYLSELCSYAPHSAPVKAPPAPRVRQTASVTTTPTGRTRSSARQTSPLVGSSSSTPLQKREGDSSHGPIPADPVIKQEEGTSAPLPESGAPVTPDGSKKGASILDLPPMTPVQNHTGHIKEGNSSSDEEGDLHASEVPYHFSQGDLYLRGSKTRNLAGEVAGYGSSEAIQHALAASIEAVDRVCSAVDPSSSKQLKGTTSGSISPLNLTPHAGASLSTSPSPLPSRRAFVLTRPPGHHCSGSGPSGFCWVNNAAVAAVHAYQTHGVDRVVIFDIDLHHGNGTQKIAWRINEETRRGDQVRAARLKAAAASLGSRSGSGRGRGSRRSGGTVLPSVEIEAGILPRGLQIFYSSLHDIESFPCEDGDSELVRDASVCLQGAHGQWIWNVHLDKYDSPSSFDELYQTKYSQLFKQARNFLSATSAEPSKTLVLLSCGFDACSYELQGMQRHGKHVPPGFYDVFARDAVQLSEEMAEGKVVSLLEGGYGDRALCSASIAHLKGLATSPCAEDGKSSRPYKMSTDAATTTNTNTTTAARHYSSTVSALDPYSHQWFSLEALKALEKTMATVLRNRSLLRSTATASSAGPGTGGGGGAAGGVHHLPPLPSASPTNTKWRGDGTSAGAGADRATLPPHQHHYHHQGTPTSMRSSKNVNGIGQDWLSRTATHFSTLEDISQPFLPVKGASRFA